jgi:hypothetical protein
MQVKTKQRKTDGQWVAKAYFLGQCLAKAEGESESAAQEAVEQEAKSVIEAELHGDDGAGREEKLQQEINGMLEKLRPYWRDKEWITLDDVIETNGCRGIEYNIEHKSVYLYVDYQNAAKFHMLKVPVGLFSNGWVIGDCKRQATCKRLESELWRRTAERKAAAMEESQRRIMEAAKKLDPEEEARKRVEEMFQIEIREFLSEQLRCLYVYGGLYEATYKLREVQIENVIAGLDRALVANAIVTVGGKCDRRRYKQACLETFSSCMVKDWSVMFDAEELMLRIAAGVHKVADSNFEAVRHLCGNMEDWLRVAKFRVDWDKMGEAAEWIDKMWEELGWGKFLDV